MKNDKNRKAYRASTWIAIRWGAFSLAVLLGMGSNAQDTFRKVRLGLTFSPSLNWITPDNTGYSGDGVRAGMSYGLMADFTLFETENYNIHTGIIFNHLGGKLSYRDAFLLSSGVNVPASTNATYKLRYVDIPLMIKLRTNEIGYLYYYGVFGGQFGFNIRAQSDVETNYGGSFSEDGIDIRDDVNLLRADLVFGGGVEYNITGETRLVAALYYHNGLTNILTGRAYQVQNGQTVINNVGQPVEDQKLRNRLHYLELKLGVLF